MVLIVRLALTDPPAAGVTELGFIEHVGALETEDCTEQESPTALLNPACEATVTVTFELWPGVTD